jgi:hypothetical protein
VDQLSLPYRIALVALLLVAALWFTILKPKDDVAAPPPQAPGVTGLANDVSNAQGAADAANASAASSEGAANAVGAEPAAAAPAAASASAPAASSAPARAAHSAKGAAKKASAKTSSDDARDRSAPLLRALDARHAVVLLFWNRAGADDRAVRAAVGGVDRRGGKVRVEAASVADVGRYEAITRGVQVVESPTVLVIGPQHTARAITGYTTKAEIDQAVGDALHGGAR